MAQQTLDENVLSGLKVNGKGWNIQLFDNQAALKSCLCASCNSVCDNPAELCCDHADDQDMFVYCRACLQQLIDDNNNKCPINSHDHPVISRNRAIRTQIAKSTVICPYSVHYKHVQNKNAGNANHAILDTLGAGPADDEKEGDIAAAADVAKQRHHVEHAADGQCQWKGTLSELISSHFVECTKRNNPTYELKQRVKALQNEVNAKQSQLDALNLRFLALQNEVNAKQKRIESLENKNRETSSQLLEQTHLVQDLMARMADKTAPKNDEQKQEEQMDEFWKFHISSECSAKFEVMDALGKSIKFKGKHLDYKYYFLRFGRFLKRSEVFSVEFTMARIGSSENYVFGFATDAYTRYAGISSHAAFIGADGEYVLKDEFVVTSANLYRQYPGKIINDEKTEKRKRLKYDWMDSSKPKVWAMKLSVNMPLQKAWITNSVHTVEFNLPAKPIQIIVGFYGNDDKVVTATYKVNLQ